LIFRLTRSFFGSGPRDVPNLTQAGRDINGQQVPSGLNLYPFVST